jgi:restriction system protein
MELILILVLILILGGFIAWLAVLQAKKLREAKREAERETERKSEALRKAKREAERKSTVERELRAFLEKHLRTLALKKRQLTTTDAYGIEDNSKWMDEKSYFINKAVLPHLSEKPTPNEIDAFVQLVEDRATALNIILYPSEDYNQGMESVQFEHFCAQIAHRVGWNARVTQGSGDQGIDVIANNSTHKVVLQCKKHTHPVGNKAVQEIVAGKHFENADFAAVVSNARFTPAARQLASSAGVALLHHTELEHYLSSLTPASVADHTLTFGTRLGKKRRPTPTTRWPTIG